MASKKTYKIFVLTLLFCFLTHSMNAQLDTIPSSNEIAFLLNSKILNQQRSIWVHVPTDYTSTNQTYPVIYLLDGDGHFKYVSQLVDYLSDYDRNRIPEMIVVGIVNIDRGKDLNLAHPVLNGKEDSDIVSTTEGGGKFLKFIQQELVPAIDRNYRTQPYRILMGHSLAGQFALYSKNIFPELFQASILISPAIHDDNVKLLYDFGLLLKQQRQLSGKLFLTIGNEGTQKVDLLVQQLKQYAPKSFKWDFKQYPDENHFSVTYKSMFDALKFLYTNWFIDFYDTTRMTYRDIELHFNKLSKEFGYIIKPTEDFVNNCGYMQLHLHNIDGAIEIFKQNIQNYPNSYNVYDSLGEAYMLKGEKLMAIKNYEKSILLNPDNENGKRMLDQLKHNK
ncbi:MAG: alpha/beta hydrolase-fold protein [Niastella sp.]|uniref:alpha/beta hydrolase-fold protein n=1 Tax=Niastella sp. TaxID=1869183 RepID=UPI00389A3257